MNRSLVYVAFALSAASLFFFAIGYNGWDCGGNVLSDACQGRAPHRLVAILLLAAGSAVFLAGIFLIFLTACKFSWCAKVAFMLAVSSAGLSIAAMVLYGTARLQLSPFIATAAMALMSALSGTLIFDLASKY
ncbi:hypothetical protein TcWFU_005588 [Taenia crassiceps]|uniref:Uncharacterized protein n=1 Tax=Taenia crassiceps TaxID=6207 RepID=A0ABR4Q783_9CEST